jgi:hypothetical protein
MRLQSLRSKLLISVSALVIGSSVVISLLETKRFSNSLREAAITQGEYLSQELGILRIGISEKHYRSEVFKLWLQMSAITLRILLLALSASFLFMRDVSHDPFQLWQKPPKILTKTIWSSA